jgi:uncharacterized membrane protein YgcG
MNKLILLACMALLWNGNALAQTDYSNRQQLAQRINALTKKYPQYAKATSMVKTTGGSDVWMLTLGTGKTESKPAVAVVGGVDGKHLLGVELAIGFAETLLASSNSDSVRRLLESQTFYVFPNMSPDATEHYFASVKYERSGNNTPLDYDRDGKTGEDGFDDLDKDGQITWMRVEDVTGKYITHATDPRIMVLADATKGEVGQYLLLKEGIDNDQDGEFNEDANEGVVFNRNTTYNYRNFLPGAGNHAVSELENRALIDFLYDAFNVYAVMTFGPYNNLSNPPSAGSAGGAQMGQGMGGGRQGGGGRMTSWGAGDARAASYIADHYSKLVGLKDAPRTVSEPGDFAEWGYYHYGRLSFSTPGWWVPKVSTEGDRGARPAGGSSNAQEDPSLNYLRWAASENITGTFTDWKVIDHPDFKGKKVEVGGVHPYVMINPPYKMVGDLVQKHTHFVVKIAEAAPKIEFTDLTTEKLDNNLTRITVKVFNSGTFPTLTAVGERSYFLKRLVVNVKTNDKQKVVSGRKTQSLGGIAGRGHVELSWLVQGTGKVVLEANNAITGNQTLEVTL